MSYGTGFIDAEVLRCLVDSEWEQRGSPPLRYNPFIVPVTSLYFVASRIAPDDPSYVFQIISKTKLKRYLSKAYPNLTEIDSGRVYLLAKAVAAARQAGAAESEMVQFFNTPSEAIDGLRPRDFAFQNGVACDLVIDLIRKSFDRIA